MVALVVPRFLLLFVPNKRAPLFPLHQIPLFPQNVADPLYNVFPPIIFVAIGERSIGLESPFG